MIEIIKHWVVLILGLTASGLICAGVIGFAISPRGAISPSIFQAESPLTATIVTTLAIALAFVISAGVGRMTNSLVGLFVLGWGIAVLDMRTETVYELALTGEPNLVLISLETAFWGAIALGLTVLMFKFSGPLPDVHPAEFEQPPHPLSSRESIKSALSGIAVLILVVVIARSPMKGQVLAAVFIGSTMAGLFARLISPHVQPILIFAAPCLFGAIGHLIGMMQLKGTMANAFVDHAIPTLNLPMPLDYVAGSLMGVAMGLGWAKSFLHHEEEPGSESSVTPQSA